MMARLFLVIGLLLASVVPAAAKNVDVPATTAAIIADGDVAIAAYTPAKKLITADSLSDLYFDSFEASGLEGAIGMVDTQFKLRLEAQFGQLIGKVRQGQPPEAVAAAWGSLRADLTTVPQRMVKEGSGFWTTFLQSFLILVREGFEAMLVVTALISYLSRSGATDKVKVVYQGVGWAVLASLATAWVFSSLISISGQGQEIMEGGTMILAALVLCYCSCWLFAKREAARWQAYVREQVNAAVSGGRLFALGFAAFLAVYREGAETVLFYQALAAGSPGQFPALIAGLAAAVVVLAAIYVAMRVLSIRLPLGVFFTATAVLLYYLAVVFAGKAVVELQNGNALSITPLDGWPSIDLIGLYPTVEGIAAQMVLLVPLAVGLVLIKLKRQVARTA